MTKEELKIGKEYTLHTFYNFKTGPHQATHLGRTEFRGKEVTVFRRETNLKEDVREYFFLNLDVRRSTKPPEELYTNLVENEEAEIILQITDERIEDPWIQLTENEKSQLAKTLKDLEESISL